MMKIIDCSTQIQIFFKELNVDVCKCVFFFCQNFEPYCFSSNIPKS